MTSRDNVFRPNYVNQLWGYLFGVGIIEPLDDIRAGNPPTNPELLDHLTSVHPERRRPAHRPASICTSRTYQLSVETNDWNADDKTNFSHAVARRLPASADKAPSRDRHEVEDPRGPRGHAGRGPAPTRASSCPAAS
ncbi:MAG: DUF1553 domain-containing protein [Isosphaeraceae bacterium]